MEELSNENCIFYLNLSDKLNRNYFVFNTSFKEKGITLVPVNYSSLLKLIREVERVHVICLVSNLTELNRFNKKVKKILKILIQNNLIDLYIASSFDVVNESSYFRGRKNYHYVKLPIDALVFSKVIATTIEIKRNKKLSWPGGKSPRPTMLNQL